MAAGLTLYSEPPLCIPIGALFQINLRVRCGHLPTQVPFFAGSQYDAARILFRDAALGLKADFRRCLVLQHAFIYKRCVLNCLQI